MTVESDTTGLRSTLASADSTVSRGQASQSAAQQTADEVLGRLTADSPRFIACAPGRLDVMGGVAEYAGSLVLGVTIADHVCVAVQRRRDGNLSIASTHSHGLDGHPPTVLCTSKLYASDGVPIDAEQGRRLVEGDDASTARCVLGVLAEMVRARMVPQPDGGLSIVVGSTLSELPAAGRDAALAAATIVALAGAYDVSLDSLDAAALCRRVENEWLGTPTGIGDALCALAGESHVLMGVRCDPCTLVSPVQMPDDLVLVGVDCGAIHPEAKLKYERARTAAFMGRALIERIIQYEGADRPKWDGYLARIAVADYVERFRDRLPTRLKGSAYLERFGETGDPLTRVDPDFTYKIRSRTEHHIYEHARACDFVKCLSRAIRNGDEQALAEAGELMRASHWSYGQRCGLGGIETDLLVNLIRAHGGEAGIFGAKITARGCGGVVAVLMRPTDQAEAALDAAISEYQSKSGCKATLIRGSAPGALVSGVRKM